jgi:hypothetical protein
VFKSFLRILSGMKSETEREVAEEGETGTWRKAWKAGLLASRAWKVAVAFGWFEKYTEYSLKKSS